MKILLVNPPYVGWLNDIKVEPIGLLYVAAHLRGLGHDVSLYDPYIGDDEANFVDLVTHWQPRIVASAVYTVSEQFCFDLARLTKQIDSSVVFVAGGPHATFAAERMLRKCAQIDVITLHESEETLAAIASAIELNTAFEDIPGVSCRAAGRIVSTLFQGLRTPIDSLAFPAKDLLSDRYYQNYRATGVITARGCAYKCDFCVSPAFFKGVRQRDLAFVAMELRDLMRRRDIRHVRFYDDVFAYNAAKMQRVKEHIGPLGLTFDCYIRVDVTTPEMLREARDNRQEVPRAWH